MIELREFCCFERKVELSFQEWKRQLVDTKTPLSDFRSSSNSGSIYHPAPADTGYPPLPVVVAAVPHLPVDHHVIIVLYGAGVVSLTWHERHSNKVVILSDETVVRL